MGWGTAIVVIHYRARGTVNIGKMFIWSGGGKDEKGMTCWLRSWGDNEPVGMSVGLGGGGYFVFVVIVGLQMTYVALWDNGAGEY